MFKELLKEKGCTVKDVCEATGIDQSTFSHWSTGQYTPKTEKMILICEFFDVPIRYFYDKITAD